VGEDNRAELVAFAATFAHYVVDDLEIDVAEECGIPLGDQPGYFQRLAESFLSEYQGKLLTLPTAPR
jgi:hypothetical protein